MSDNTYMHHQQGGPGPPFAAQAIPSYSPDRAVISRQHSNVASPGVSTSPSRRPAAPIGPMDQAGLTQAMGRQALSVGQQGLPVDQHPVLAFVPPGFQGMVHGGAASGACPPMGAAAGAGGYYSYPHVSSVYPYNVMGQHNSPAVALDPEGLAAVNRALALASPATSVAAAAAAAGAANASAGAMESAWGAQYASGGWHATAAAAAAAASLHFSVRGANAPFAGVSVGATPASDTSSNTTRGPVVAEVPSVAATIAFSSPPAGGTFEHQERQQQQQSRGESCPTSATPESNKAEREARSSPTLAPLAPPPPPSLPATSATTAATTEIEDSAGEFELDSMGKRRRLTAEERLQRSRERNQLHARKTRQRKKAQLQVLMNRSAELQAEQQQLRQAITDRRTASILLGMSGSDDVQQTGKASKASRDHPPALAAMSGKTPRAGMLSALESDTGEGSSKGTGGNGSDDLGSETTAGTRSSTSSSGRTSSEANSSDGAVGVGGGGGGGDGEDGDAIEQLKVGNPGDTERLLELSQKTRSDCTPEELEQIRRERNRMHAKRTRDRKKLHLEATEGMIARLEKENRKLRDNIKAIGTGGSAGVDSTSSVTTAAAKPATPVKAASSTAAPAPAQRSSCVAGFAPPSGPQQAPAAAPQQSGGAQVRHAPPPARPATQQMANHAFLPHGPHMPPQLHGHMYPPQHHLPHAAQMIQSTPTMQHMGYFPQGFDQGGHPVNLSGSASAGGGGGSGGDASGTGLKSDMNAFLTGGHVAPVGLVGHSNPHFQAHPSLLPYQGPPATFGSASGKPPILSTGPQQMQHVYPVPDQLPKSKSWDGIHQRLGVGAPSASFVPWPRVRSTPGEGITDATSKASLHNQLASSPLGKSEPQKAGGAGGEKESSTSDAKRWKGSRSTPCNGNNSSSGSSSSGSGGSSGGRDGHGSAGDECNGKKSSHRSTAGNSAARHLARVMADEARAEEAAREENQHKLDRDLSRGCQEAWQKVRRERSAKRKRSAASSAHGSSRSGDCGSSGGGEPRQRQRRRSMTSRASEGASTDSCSERDGGGSGGEGSECSSSSSSSSCWMEGSDSSSVLPASSTSCEMSPGGRDCDSGSVGSHSSSSSSSSSSSGGGKSAGSESGSDNGRRRFSHHRRNGSAANEMRGDNEDSGSESRSSERNGCSRIRLGRRYSLTVAKSP